jgi:DNA-binding SARP family transcriptional activator/Flp pilus assembly protein TadD
VEFRVLGDLEVRAAGRRIGVGHARQRAVLAVLLLDLGHVVPADQLIDRVWGEDPPASVRNVLYGYVARLRAALAGTGDLDVTLARRQGGYVLEADPDRVDLYRFRRMVTEAAGAEDDQAAALLRGALELWRGPALAGLDGPWLRGMRDTLDLQRVAALLDLGDVALRRGEHGALVSEMAGEAAAYPADERLIGQLMLALYRSGQAAEALRWFERTRQRLAEELGIDPAPALRVLHQRILRSDPSLAAPTAAGPAKAPGGPAKTPAGRAGGPVPRELPMDVTAFTGRAAELAELDGLLEPGGPAVASDEERSTAAVISAVSGTAGVGKTALAVHWAHRVAGHFPDGQLYVNLRGYDPDQPVTAADALATFLRALGVAGQDIPAEEDERAARYRSLLAGRRILVVADNAAEVTQVRPLLPGNPACVVLVTSRDSLVGLVARDGATRLDLDLLPQEDAVGLLRALIGVRAEAEADAVAALAGRCARLPLALRVAAELAVARPDVSLADLAGELADQQSRLDLLDAGGDPHTAVRAVFSWSYEHLDAAAARAFRLLGLHPGPSFEPYAAAALTESAFAQARKLLALLARAHLIQRAEPGRYGMHDLLRAYAAEQAASHDGDDERQAALTRLFDHYLHAAATAMDALFPAETSRRPRVRAPATPAPLFTDPDAARVWLEAHRTTLMAVVAYTASHGWPGHATRLANTLDLYLANGSYFADAITIYTHARRAAREAGDLAGEVDVAINHGFIDWLQGRLQQAADNFQQAVTLARQIGDQLGEGRAVGRLGIVCEREGNYERAIDHYQRALILIRAVGDKLNESRVLGNLGVAHRRQGRYQQALDCQNQSLALCRALGDPGGEALALTRLGVIDKNLGRYDQAASHHRQALALFRKLGDRHDTGEALTDLGVTEQRLGQYKEAIGHHRQALALFRELGDPVGETRALNGLGEALCAEGEPGEARVHHDGALAIADQMGERDEQARGHNGLGHSYRAAGDPGQARRHWQEALALYTYIGAPEAEQVRAQLAAADLAAD